MLKYKKMSLFDVPKKSILVHAVNCQGVWGSGIAKEFKEKYPNAFEDYKIQCRGYKLLGSCSIVNENEQIVVSIGTSNNYGILVDTPNEILVNTTLSLNDLCILLEDHDYIIDVPIYSNKFNSGLFNVPWDKTSAILEVFVKRYNLDWTICEI